MNPLVLEEIHTGKLQAFTKFGKFIGWIIKSGDTWTARPSNGWKVLDYPSKAKAARYMISTIRKYK